MSTYPTATKQLDKSLHTDKRTKTNKLVGPAGTTTTLIRGTRTRSILVTETGPYTQSEAEAALVSSDTTDSTGAGVITSSRRRRRGGVHGGGSYYYVETTTDTRSAWTWEE